MEEKIPERLFMVKDMFLNGNRHAYFNSKFDRRIAIISYHNSIELLLRHYLSQKYQSDDLDGMKFEKKLDEVEDMLVQKNKGDISEKGYIIDLNKLRNKVYHSYETPTTEEIIFYKIVTHNFLSEVVHKKSKLDFDKINYFDRSSIRNPFVKDSYNQALKFYDDGNYLRATIHLVKAFDEQWESAYGSFLAVDEVKLDFDDDPKLQSIIDEINSSAHYLEERLKEFQLRLIRKEHLNLRTYVHSDTFAYYKQIALIDLSKLKLHIEEFIAETDSELVEPYLEKKIKQYKQIQANSKW